MFMNANLNNKLSMQLPLISFEVAVFWGITWSFIKSLAAYGLQGARKPIIVSFFLHHRAFRLFLLMFSGLRGISREQPSETAGAPRRGSCLAANPPHTMVFLRIPARPWLQHKPEAFDDSRPFIKSITLCAIYRINIGLQKTRLPGMLIGLWPSRCNQE